MSKPSGVSFCRPGTLTLYHYRELAAADRLQVEEHLQRCAACRRELAQLQAVLGLLPKAELETSAEEIRAFNQRLNRRLQPPRRWPVRPALGWSLAAGAALLLTVTLRPQAPEPLPAIPGAHLQIGGETPGFPAPDLLLNLELLENLDMLQELEGTGSKG